MAQELQFIETDSGDWFYILEQPHAPKDVWDWHEFAYAYAHSPLWKMRKPTSTRAAATRAAQRLLNLPARFQIAHSV